MCPWNNSMCWLLYMGKSRSCAVLLILCSFSTASKQCQWTFFVIFFSLSCLADSGLIDQPFWEKSVQVPFFPPFVSFFFLSPQDLTKLQGVYSACGLIPLTQTRNIHSGIWVFLSMLSPDEWILNWVSNYTINLNVYCYEHMKGSTK